MKKAPEKLIELACPNCEARFSVEPVTQLEPDSPYLSALVAGTLNCVECPQCHNHLNIPLRLVYRDPVRPFMVVHEVKKVSAEMRKAVAQQLDEEATAAAVEAKLLRPTVRLVWTRQDFIEKIFLHQNGLDDRVVEYAKYQLFNGGADGAINGASHSLLYDFTQKDPEQLVFLVFERSSGRPIRILQVPMAEYQRMAEEFQVNPQLQKELELAFPGCYVSVDSLLSAVANK